MKQYHDMLDHVINNGSKKNDRTGVGTISSFGYQTRFDLSNGFPLVTTKKLHLKSVIHELLWFISGDSNIDYLNKNGVTIWDEWADANGDLGKIYDPTLNIFKEPMPVDIVGIACSSWTLNTNTGIYTSPVANPHLL